MTKRKAKPLELRQPADGRRMTAAIDWCLEEGLPVRRCTLHQIHVGPWNFWPERGTFTFEASPAGGATGLKAFKEAIAAWAAKERAEYD